MDPGHGGLLHHYLALAEPYLERYGLVAVFVGVTIESFGIPAPGQSLIIASGLLAARGDMSLLALPLAWAAAILGDNIGWAIGHYGGRRLVLHHGRRFGLRQRHLEHVEHFFDRYGAGIIMFARFFEVLRQLNGVVAGTSGMPWWRFLVYNAIGATLWVLLWGVGAYFLGRHLEQALAFFHRFEPWVIAIGVTAFLGTVVYVFGRWQRRRRA
jgi:membrane protein DedA with SNARE-associated domain